jgi:hypothetical protein
MVQSNLDSSVNAIGSDQLHGLDRDGFLILRNAIPAAWLEPLRAAFEAGIEAAAQAPVPRGADWRHSLLDTDDHVQLLCRLPALLGGVRHLMRQPFFLSQVEGREPRHNNAAQLLHRDAAESPGEYVAAMAWLDPYGADNGATQVIAGSHRHSDAPLSEARVLKGEAGDILLFDPDVLHGATVNSSGARRRSLLLSFAAAKLRPQLVATETLRNVRMDSSEIFE